MFKPCPNCGFLVALIAGREASQRCPRCGSALAGEADAVDGGGEAQAPFREHAAASDAAAAADAGARSDAGPAPVATAPAHIGRDARAPLPAVTPPPLGARESDRQDGGGAEASVARRRSATVEAADPAVTHAASAAGDRVQPAAVASTSASAPQHAGSDAEAVAVHDGPSFMRRRAAPPARRVRRAPWVAALVALALLLALQLVLAQRTELAADPAWRPLVLRVCGVLGCEVPAWREPRAFAMLARGVRPSRAGVLHATATVRNDARWPQPAPVVVLSLSDIDGRLMGARAVPPREYGHGSALIAPGESLDIAFDVREPAGHVESFDFQLQ